MKTASAKAKGRELQKHIASSIEATFSLEDGDAVSRPMGSGGVDILLSPAARKKFPFSVEAKNWKKSPGHAELMQSYANAYPETLPALVHKPKGKGMKETLITFRLEDFMNFWKEKTNG